MTNVIDVQKNEKASQPASWSFQLGWCGFSSCFADFFSVFVVVRCVKYPVVKSECCVNREVRFLNEGRVLQSRLRVSVFSLSPQQILPELSLTYTVCTLCISQTFSCLVYRQG